MHLADEHLLRNTAEGDHESFAALYDAYSPRVYGLIVKLMGRRPEAEDVLQEVFAEIWRRAAVYNSALGSAETWILMIARSRSIDRLRKLRRELRHTEALAASLPRADRPPSPLDSSDHSHLTPAVEDLPPELRDVVQMAYSQGLTREEIASALAIPVGTVKTRLRSAVSRLAASLAGQQESMGGHAT